MVGWLDDWKKRVVVSESTIAIPIPMREGKMGGNEFLRACPMNFMAGLFNLFIDHCLLLLKADR